MEVASVGRNWTGTEEAASVDISWTGTGEAASVYINCFVKWCGLRTDIARAQLYARVMSTTPKLMPGRILAARSSGEKVAKFNFRMKVSRKLDDQKSARSAMP